MFFELLLELCVLSWIQSVDAVVWNMGSMGMLDLYVCKSPLGRDEVSFVILREDSVKHRLKLLNLWKFRCAVAKGAHHLEWSISFPTL